MSAESAEARRDLDTAIAAALPFAGGRVRVALAKLRAELAMADEQRAPLGAPPPAETPPGPVIFGAAHVLASGSYDTYEVHCVMASKEDADAAKEALNGAGTYYFTQTLPVVPAGHMPRKLPVYRVILTQAAVEGRSEVRPFEDEVWEWEWQKYPDGQEQPGRMNWPNLAEFHGRDREQVERAAAARIAELCANATDGGSA
jgi:hypothetical protein